MDRILHIRDCLPVPDAEILVVYARALRWRGCAVLSDRGVEYPYRADPRRSAIRNDAQCANGIEQAGEDPGVVLYTAMVRQMHTWHWYMLLTDISVVGLAIAHVALLPSFTHSTDVSCKTTPLIAYCI